MGENYINLRETAQALRHILSTDAEAADTLRDSYDGRLPSLDDQYGYEFPEMPADYRTTIRPEDEQRNREEDAS